MTFRETLAFGVAVGIALTSITDSAAQAEDLKAAYQAQAAWALHLLETGRYGEAEDAAQNLVVSYPDAAMPYELRGTTALYVGSVSRAWADFAKASELGRDPAASYGQALCAMAVGKPETAQAALTAARQTDALTETQAATVETAHAYLAYLKGDFHGAQTSAAQDAADDPLRAEVAALAAYRLDPKAGAARVAQTLTTASGVPDVREEDGLRPTFEVGLAVEPCVIEPDLQAMYADRLKGNLDDAARKQGTVTSLSGTADLSAPVNLPAQTTLVSFSIDGQMAAMVNQPPYAFHWNTAHVANGTHTIRVDAVDDYGNTLLSQTQTVRVVNKDAGSVTPAKEEDDPKRQALMARLWNLLRLRPSRKVAEWTLAQAALAGGDRVDADAHLANAAALDPSYKGGRRFARALFGSPASTIGRVASTQPVSLWRGNATRKEIALTFDDGPNPLKTPALLDALDKAQAPATFFVVGSRAEQAPDILRRMAERGDEVENHSYSHPNMNLVIPSVAESEILRTCVLIRAMTGHQPHFFRPPGGNANDAVQHLARMYGLSLAYWTVDALHAEDVGSSRDLIDYVMSHVHPGSIVLLHNGTDVTTASVPALVSALRARGYKLVTLSEVAQGAGAAKPAALPKMKE